MGAALRIILIIVIVWYVVRVIERVIGPALFGTSTKEKSPPPGPRGSEFRKSTRQGDVTITNHGKDSKDEKPEKDDYVDYEEVD